MFQRLPQPSTYCVGCCGPGTCSTTSSSAFAQTSTLYSVWDVVAQAHQCGMLPKAVHSILCGMPPPVCDGPHVPPLILHALPNPVHIVGCCGPGTCPTLPNPVHSILCGMPPPVCDGPHVPPCYSCPLHDTSSTIGEVQQFPQGNPDPPHSSQHPGGGACFSQPVLLFLEDSQYIHWCCPLVLFAALGSYCSWCLCE
jgi:hypothetical protein